ncbi:MAG: D-alanyl-D-alanine carboxypeptidase family protein [Prochloraceae cyanobacterium]
MNYLTYLSDRELFDNEMDWFDEFNGELECLHELEAELEGRVNRSSRDYIKWVQRSLNKILGAGLTVDGIKGRKTRSAIKEFQFFAGITIDGKVGSQTENALMRFGATKPPNSSVISSPSGRRCIIYGDCKACERRITGGKPINLISIPPELLRNQNKKLFLNQEALRAYQKLLREARADGIAKPYLTILSGHRKYDLQARLWRKRLLAKFSKLGYSGAIFDCISTAINKTNRALKSKSFPHKSNDWLNRFLSELRKANCSASDDASSLVKNLRQTTAPPGRSTHHSGRTVDIEVGHAPGFNTANSKPENVKWQRKQAPYRWMVCNAHRFGFHPYLREPWHWEYNP